MLTTEVSVLSCIFVFNWNWLVPSVCMCVITVYVYIWALLLQSNKLQGKKGRVCGSEKVGQNRKVWQKWGQKINCYIVVSSIWVVALNSLIWEGVFKSGFVCFLYWTNLRKILKPFRCMRTGMSRGALCLEAILLARLEQREEREKKRDEMQEEEQGGHDALVEKQIAFDWSVLHFK